MKLLFAGVLLFVLSGCAGKHVAVLEDNSLSLHGCSPLPNCVSSTTSILYNRTSPFVLAMAGPVAWAKIREVVVEMPRTEIVESDDHYLHAKCTSRVFRFVDHLELVLRADGQTVDVRSSSTIAIFDLGVNRMRIAKLRKRLAGMKIIR